MGYIGAFYGNYFFWVNVAARAAGFVATRLIKSFGLAGVLLALPLVAVGAYGIIALGATIAIVRWAKTAENATDYSVMNTAKQLLWLPTSREEKYKAKQAVDGFFYGSETWPQPSSCLSAPPGSRSGPGLRDANLLFVIAWLPLAARLVRENRRLSAR